MKSSLKIVQRPVLVVVVKEFLAFSGVPDVETSRRQRMSTAHGSRLDSYS